MWTRRQTRQHREAGILLGKIKDGAFEYVRTHPRCSELDVQKFILEQYKKHNLKTALGRPIVAFGPSVAFPHYNPARARPRKLRKGYVVEIDVWARLNEPRAPYADITWVGYVGKRIPKNIKKVFDIVLEARSASLSLLRNHLRKKKLPTGYEVDHAAMQVLLLHGYKYRKEILHTTGHSLGTASPHGVYGAISSKNKELLKKNLGYTIEPGIYLKGKFGIRSEINFYITSSYKLEITSKVQKSLLLI